ncbi:UNVERIFIED_CONTAM: hypothetical protein FKN15_025470 [Acipenser sinensis]
MLLLLLAVLDHARSQGSEEDNTDKEVKPNPADPSTEVEYSLLQKVKIVQGEEDTTFTEAAAGQPLVCDDQRFLYTLVKYTPNLEL